MHTCATQILWSAQPSAELTAPIHLRPPPQCRWAQLITRVLPFPPATWQVRTTPASPAQPPALRSLNRAIALMILGFAPCRVPARHPGPAPERPVIGQITQTHGLLTSS